MPKKKDNTRKRTRLTAIQKKSIQEKKKDNPNLKDEEIALEFNCDRSTVSKILKQKKWSEVQETSQISNALKIASPKFPQVEKALEIWIGSAEQQNLIITGDIIRQKALQFATLLGISDEEFKASQGWLACFKARIGHYNHQIHGESESAPIEFLPQFREELKVLLAAYEPQNIFNADECGLYYRMDPKYTLSTTARSGRIKDKTGITILLTANADGTKKLAPLVINTSKMPNAFRYANITSHNQLPVNYYHNESAWMHQDIFQKYLRNLQRIFQIQERKILHLDKIFPEFEMMIEDIETQNIQVSEVIVAQHEAQDIIDLTHDTDI
ncbi:20555_t:CDS:2 [Gigaspora rosea]|nr:20555_t:CDS:2 [Gigaspora rosea]